MVQQIEFSYNDNFITITDNTTKDTLTISRSGNTVESIEEDKQTLLKKLNNAQKDYSI